MLALLLSFLSHVPIISSTSVSSFDFLVILCLFLSILFFFQTNTSSVHINVFTCLQCIQFIYFVVIMCSVILFLRFIAVLFSHTHCLVNFFQMHFLVSLLKLQFSDIYQNYIIFLVSNEICVNILIYVMYSRAHSSHIYTLNGPPDPF